MEDELRFADGDRPIGCDRLAPFLFSIIDIDRLGQVGRLLERLLVVQEELVVEGRLVIEEVVEDVCHRHPLVFEDGVTQFHHIFFIDGVQQLLA